VVSIFARRWPGDARRNGIGVLDVEGDTGLVRAWGLPEPLPRERLSAGTGSVVNLVTAFTFGLRCRGGQPMVTTLAWQPKASRWLARFCALGVPEL
jgi:hypothetical protein